MDGCRYTNKSSGTEAAAHRDAKASTYGHAYPEAGPQAGNATTANDTSSFDQADACSHAGWIR